MCSPYTAEDRPLNRTRPYQEHPSTPRLLVGSTTI